MQEPQPLGCDLLGEIVDAGGVAARPGKAGDKTKLNRVFADAEDNRDRRSRSFGCLCSKVAGRRGDNGDAPVHEVSHERWQTIELALQPMVLDRYVLILNETGFAEAFAERGSTRRRGIGCPGVYEADHWQGRLLRCATSGQPVTPLPRSAMNSRRLMGLTPRPRMTELSIAGLGVASVARIAQKAKEG